MSRSETIKRYLFMLLGMFTTALGVALCVRADMGISPITTLPYTMHNVIPALSLGTFVFFQNLIFLFLTAVLLGKAFRLNQLLQIPLSFLHGAFVDFWEILLRGPVPSLYIVRVLLVLAGIVFVGLGFSVILNSGVALESNTAFVNAMAYRLKKPYGKLKTISDVVTVALAAILSLVFLHKIVGIREGTVISAVLIGKVAGFFNRYLVKAERLFVPAK